eukprot:scaffold81890_cov18-Prasinocladus_malaysianus.AAC.1
MSLMLQTLRYEAFTYYQGKQEFVTPASTDSDLFPYLLVNIGSGVSIVKASRPPLCSAGQKHCCSEQLVAATINISMKETDGKNE